MEPLYTLAWAETDHNDESRLALVVCSSLEAALQKAIDRGLPYNENCWAILQGIPVPARDYEKKLGVMREETRLRANASEKGRRRKLYEALKVEFEGKPE